MKQLRAWLMLGPFALILMIATVLIGAAVASVYVVNEYFDDVYATTERRLQYQIAEASLLDIQVLSRQAIMASLYGDESDQVALADAKDEQVAAIDEALAVLEEIAYEDRDAVAITAIQERRDMLANNFDDTQISILEALAESVGAGVGIDEGENNPFDLFYTLINDEIAVNERQRTLIDETQQQLDAAVQDLEAIKAVLIWLVLGALMIFPLLAVVGFLLASRFTQPLLQIDNAIMAVGGDHYRPALMEDTLRRRDPLGTLAKAVDKMAGALKARDAALEQEVTDLRQRLQEIRRRKLSTAVDIPTHDLIGRQ